MRLVIFLTGIAEAVANSGEEVYALCAQPSYNQRGTRAPKREVHNGVAIRRCWSTTFDPRKIVGRLINFATTSLSIAWQSLLQIRSGDRVLVVTNPPLLPFLVRVVCCLKRAKFVLLVHDVYPDVFVPLGLMTETHPLYRTVSWVNGRLYASAHAIVVLGRDMARLVDEKSKGRANVEVIPNWGDIEAIQPQAKEANQLLTELNIQDKFIVHYSGNHGRTHDLLSLIQAAEILKDDADVHFLFIGDGSGKAAAVEYAEAQELTNVSFRSFVDRSELSTSLNASDVSVVAFKAGMAGISVPSRLYNLMAAGKPILAVVDSGSEVAQVISEAQIGAIVTPQHPKELAAAVRTLKQDDLARKEMAARSRKETEAKYSYGAVSKLYCQLFGSLK